MKRRRASTTAAASASASASAPSVRRSGSDVGRRRRGRRRRRPDDDDHPNEFPRRGCRATKPRPRRHPERVLTVLVVVPLAVVLVLVLVVSAVRATAFFPAGSVAPAGPRPRRSLGAADAALPEESDNDDDDALGGATLRGKHKWLGGAVDPRTGSIYGVPSHAESLIRLRPHRRRRRRPLSSGADTSDPKGEEEQGGYDIATIPLPPVAAAAGGKYKWLRGVVPPNGRHLFGIPSWADSVVRVDLTRADGDDVVPEDAIDLLPLPPEHEPSRWQWHGASLNADGTAIYCVPSNARSVLKIDIASGRTTLLPIPETSAAPLGATNKWYGGILGVDGAVYGVPYAAGGVLRIDCATDAVSVEGDYGDDRYNWHGGILCPENGSIYAFPSHSPFVLKIDTSRNGARTLLPILRAPDDAVTRYKWLGGATGADGRIYGVPSDASSVLRIDPRTDDCVAFGFAGVEKNKWQGGVLAGDGFVYAVPSDARSVLRIDTRPETTKERRRTSLLGELPSRKDKWQGGFLGYDGSVYGIPENARRVLKVSPPTHGDDDHDAGVKLM